MFFVILEELSEKRGGKIKEDVVGEVVPDTTHGTGEH
jgi:hypothetical protein